MLGDRGGNFGIMTAILLPVLFGAAGMAIQVGDILLSKQQLQEAADSAALATATALANGTIQTSQAEAFARDFVAGQMANYMQSSVDIKSTTGVDVRATTSGKSTSYQVTVSPSYDLAVNPLMQAVGFSTQHLSTSGTTVSGHSQTQGSISMYLALDKSGSMGDPTATVNADDPTESFTYDCNLHYNSKNNKWVYDKCTGSRTNYYTKIEALKLAAGNLLVNSIARIPTQNMCAQARYPTISLNTQLAVSPGGLSVSQAMSTHFRQMAAQIPAAQ